MARTRKQEKLTRIADRLFIGSITAQVFLTLVLTALISATVYSYQRERSNDGIKHIFSDWERRITESVYVDETLGNSASMENSQVKGFARSLIQNNIQSEVQLASCSNPPERSNRFSLSVGSRMLQTCLYVSTPKPNLFENMKWLLISACLSLSIMILSWLFVRRKMNAQVLDPLITEIRTKSKTESLGEVVAQVAHDLRSHIAVLQLLENESSLPEDRRPLINGALRQVGSIIDDLIAQYRAHTNGLPIPSKVQVVNLQPLVKSVILEKNVEHGIEIDLQINPKVSDDFVQVDPTAYRRVLSNVLNNAFQASKNPAKKITVNLEGTDAMIELKIQDQGSGIPSGILSRLGKEPWKSERADGLGIGLLHAFQTASEWGGEIDIASKINLGTCVTIRIPRYSSTSNNCSRIQASHGTPIAQIEDNDYIRSLWTLNGPSPELR